MMGKVTRLFSGKYRKKFFLRKFFPTCLSIFFSCLVISGIIFDSTNPSGYSLVENPISDLGNPVLNPYGWFFFSAAFVFFSIILLPMYMFLYQRLKKMESIFPKIGIISNVVSSIGMGMLAFFPNKIPSLALHGLAALLAFGGICSGIISSWIAIARDAYIKARRERRKIISLAIVSIFVLLIFITVTGTTELVFRDLFGESKSWFLAFSFWEWMLFFAISLQIGFIIFILPDHMEVNYLHDSKHYLDA
ncbi:DUF998 domain-containing protein [Candidatus Bathyarchaeota archaeon]|nr:DUF998 domain-containing protein [Candidatus Bathyarchaeota archaeon]